MEYVKIPIDKFTHTWRCGVVASGYHNGSTCTPEEPHQGWGCRWIWRITFTDADFHIIEKFED